jgi:hypothetical protein
VESAPRAYRLKASNAAPPISTFPGAIPFAIGPAIIQVGAIVTDNQGHDLGYRTFLNGTLVSNIVIDTTQVATDTIDYVATDTWGNTATSTRTVIVEASPSIVPANGASPATASASTTATTTTP